MAAGRPATEGAEGRGAVGAPGGFGAAGGAVGRATGGGIAAEGAGAEGGGEEATGMAEVVFREGGAIGGAGSFTGEVLAFGAGGGSGAEGSWMGAVAFLATVGTTEVVFSEAGMPPVAGETGAVASRGWVTPAPGRPRRVMRTVSFFNGTAAVLGVDPGGGVFSGSLMRVGTELAEFVPFSENHALASIPFSSRLAFVSGLSVNPAIMNILVTGGAGFIGSHTSERLLRDDAGQVTIIDNVNDYYNPAIKRENLKALGSKVKFREGDITDPLFVTEAFDVGRFDAVIHLAARAGVRPSIEQPELYIDTNIKGTFNLLEASRRTGVKHFVCASSSSVYGVNKKIPFTETDPILQTISPYAMTKMAGEQMCSNYGHLYGIKTVNLRFFTVYGPRQRPDLAISKFTRLIEDGKPIDKYGDGTTRRDYTYIDDIVDGIIGALNYRSGPINDIFNLGGSQNVSLNDLITTIEQAVGKKAAINQLPEQPGDVPVTSADVSKAVALIGFKPTTTISQGVPRYVEWFRDMRSRGVAVC